MYGPGGNRTKSTYGSSRNFRGHKYEKHYSTIIPAEIVRNRETDERKFIFYKGGDAYTAPLVRVEKYSGSRSDGGADYYLHRDYLGSILTFVKEVQQGRQVTGQVVERRQFGAWGTVDYFWQEGQEGDMTHESLWDRGYTGHEHFFEVGLIHMNGRMYDPQIKAVFVNR